MSARALDLALTLLAMPVLDPLDIGGQLGADEDLAGSHLHERAGGGRGELAGEGELADAEDRPLLEGDADRHRGSFLVELQPGR